MVPIIGPKGAMSIRALVEDRHQNAPASWLQPGKPQDARQALTRFRPEVETLVTQGKLDATSAELLLTSDAASLLDEAGAET